jgi:hypothetical protein
MTADSGTNPVTDWDEARIALGRVSTFFQDHPGFDPAELPSAAASGNHPELETYELIPQPVRDAIEHLSQDEMTTVIDSLATLAENHFYLENNLGRGLEPY